MYWQASTEITSSNYDFRIMALFLPLFYAKICVVLFFHSTLIHFDFCKYVEQPNKTKRRNFE